MNNLRNKYLNLLLITSAENSTEHEEKIVRAWYTVLKLLKTLFNNNVASTLSELREIEQHMEVKLSANYYDRIIRTVRSTVIWNDLSDAIKLEHEYIAHVLPLLHSKISLSHAKEVTPKPRHLFFIMYQAQDVLSNIVFDQITNVNKIINKSNLDTNLMLENSFLPLRYNRFLVNTSNAPVKALDVLVDYKLDEVTHSRREIEQAFIIMLGLLNDQFDRLREEQRKLMEQMEEYSHCLNQFDLWSQNFLANMSNAVKGGA
jgi:hypothetical protein